MTHKYPFKHKTTSSYVISGVRLDHRDGQLLPQESQQGDSVTLKIEQGILTAIGSEGDREAWMKPGSDGKSPVHIALSEDDMMFPAGVDPQVHLRVPGQAQKETAETGLQAAIAGGIGALLTMPNTNPVLDSIEALELAKTEIAAAQKYYPVNVLYSGTISMGMKGKEPSDYEAMRRWGISALTDDGLGVESTPIMENVFAYSEKSGIPVLQHAEFLGHKGVLAPGPEQRRLGIREYPDSAEWEMVARDLKALALQPNARYHVLHVSSKKTVSLIAEAKQTYGNRVTAEVSPHHLYFNSDDVAEGNPAFKMNPPLRSPEDQQALCEALNEGIIDFVATDHAPHEPEVKDVGLKNSAYGTVGLETFLPVLITMRRQGKIKSWRRVWEAFTTAGAKFLGIADEGFGSITIGKPFRVCVFAANDQAREFTQNQLYGKSKNSCFLGSRLEGDWRYTMCESEIFSPE